MCVAVNESGFHNGNIVSSEKVITWRLGNPIINNRPSGMCYTFGLLIYIYMHIYIIFLNIIFTERKTDLYFLHFFQQISWPLMHHTNIYNTSFCVREIKVIYV